MIADTVSIKSQLQQLPDLPAAVQSWRVEEGTNWMDDPAVWVWAVTKQGEIDTRTRNRLRVRVREYVGEITDGLWAYVLIRGADEDESAT